jgi:hypothetical protein
MEPKYYSVFNSPRGDSSEDEQSPRKEKCESLPDEQEIEHGIMKILDWEEENGQTKDPNSSKVVKATGTTNFDQVG